MHIFTHFTRSTRLGEFAWVGAIMVSGQFSGGQFSSEAAVRGRGEGCAFLFVEVIPFRGILHMVTSIEIIEKAVFWSATTDHWAQ